jgi:hypothetical protein
MKPWMTPLTVMCLGAAVVACQQSAPNSQTNATSPTPTTSSSTTTTTETASTPPAAVERRAKADICALLTAAEVSAIMGKPLLQDPHSCDFGLDPAAKEKALADAGVKPGASDAQNMGAMMQAFAKGGQKKVMGTVGVMSDQLNVMINADQDGMSEEKAKEFLKQVGGTVNGALHPDQRGLHDVITVSDEIPGVGDWAFATNTASVSMMGMTIRGRQLMIGKGPWRITVGATISPDPGTAVLDQHLAQVAKALIAKLPS